jgi:uncharacterized phage protein (TIGR01671 family)
MREILFRGKKVGSDEWVEGWLVHTNKKMPPCIYVGQLEVYEVNPKTIGQFTGVSDILSSKIFEDDIVQVFVGTDTNQTLKYQIRFIYGAFQLVELSGAIINPIAFVTILNDLSDRGIMNKQSINQDFYDSFQVVGNIHDNKDLLKG